MLVQDTLTGALHQVPDDSLYGYAEDDGVVYDGYGNPVGFPPLIPILSALAPVVLPPLMKAVSSAFKGADGYGYADDYVMDGWDGYGDAYGAMGDDVLLDGYGYAAAPAEGQIVYDGFGNPVGFAPIIGALGKLVPTVASAASRLLPGIARTAARAIPGVVQSAARAIPSAVRSILPGVPRPRFPFPLPRPSFPGLPFRRPVRAVPPGWTRPALPYTGMRPNRLYMRCATWPGPAGLVPTHPGTPGTPGTPAAPVRVARRRRRRRRR